MDRGNDHPAPAQAWLDAAAVLRAKAETLYRQRATCATTNPRPLSPQATGQLLRELQVQQIELELQYEELRNTQLNRSLTTPKKFL